MLVHHVRVEDGQLFVGRGVEVAADGIHLFGDAPGAAPRRPFEEHVLEQVRDAAPLGRFFGRARPRAKMPSVAERTCGIGSVNSRNAAGQHALANHPLDPRASSLRNVGSQKTSAPLARASRRSRAAPWSQRPSPTTAWAKSPLTTAPLPASTGTVTHRSTSAIAGSTANAPATSAVDLGAKRRRVDAPVKLHARERQAAKAGRPTRSQRTRVSCSASGRAKQRVRDAHAPSRDRRPPRAPWRARSPPRVGRRRSTASSSASERRGEPNSFAQSRPEPWPARRTRRRSRCAPAGAGCAWSRSVASLTAASHSGRSHHGMSIIPARSSSSRKNSARSPARQRVRFEKRLGLREKRGLDLVQRGRDLGHDRVERDRALLAFFFERAVAPDQRRDAGFEVARAELDAQRHAAHVPLVELEARRLALALVELDAQAGLLARREQVARSRIEHGRAVAAHDRHDHDLDRRHLRRNAQAAIVAVHHDQRAEHAPRHPPRRRPGELLRLVLGLERDVVGAREVLAELVRGPGLQRLAVGHQRFDRVGVGRRRQNVRSRSSRRGRPERRRRSRQRRDRRRACAPLLRPPPARSRARCGLLATETRACARTAACAFPSAARWPTG